MLFLSMKNQVIGQKQPELQIFEKMKRKRSKIKNDKKGEKEKMKVKAIHYIGALLVALIAISGYYVYQQQQQATPSSSNMNSFEKYAQTLGLNVQQFTTCLDTKKYLSGVQTDYYDGQLYGVSGTPTFFINGQQIVGAQPFAEFKSAIDAQLVNPTSNATIRAGSNPVRGTANAPVTIVEFADYQCTYCALVQTTVDQVMQQYQGKVQLYFRDFPLPPSMHPFAQQAALASRCAGEQGKFWEYHDMLYANQQEWTAG